jgi:hypothetical protein
MKTKNKVLIFLIALTGVGISVYIYKEFKTKSILKMNDAEKKNFVLNAEKELWDIRNNSKITQEEKNVAIQNINKKNEDTYTEEEKKIIANQWVKELQAGNIKLALSPSDLGVGLIF